MPKIAEKAIFIPTAHQEPFIDLNIYKSVFESCRAYIFLTDEERELVSRKFNISGKPYEVTGAGVDVPPDISSEAFREKYGIYDDYIIYVGRIDEGKNCPEFFDQFIKYKKRNAGGLKLVLMGKAVVPVPEHKDIINLGFVSDEDKFNGISGAKLLVLPSRFESLSISVLEAMTLSVPVLVNGACNVLKGHCTKSNGGLYYTNYFELEGALNYIFSHPEEYGIMCRNARRYVDDNYQWNVILDKICSVIEKTSGC